MIQIKLHEFVVKAYTNYNVQFKLTSDKSISTYFIEDTHFNSLEISSTSTKFDYFNGALTKITVVCNYQDECEVEMIESPTIIKQISMNTILQITFMEDMKRGYDLQPYNNDYAPAIFYGILDNIDMNRLRKNKSLKVIVWIGGDMNHNVNISKKETMNQLARIKEIKCMTKIKHIAISSFISNSLSLIALPHKFVPFMGVDFSLYIPVTKGPCIYLYTNSALVTGGQYYGSEMYFRLMKKYSNIEFKVACCKHAFNTTIKTKNNPININYYDRATLVSTIYSSCFIGLRLTYHDGLAATVQELGLLGIKTIHNGCSPSSLNYNSFEDICDHIDREIATIGTVDAEMAAKVRDYLTIDKSFFSTESYQT